MRQTGKVKTCVRTADLNRIIAVEEHSHKALAPNH